MASMQSLLVSILTIVICYTHTIATISHQYDGRGYHGGLSLIQLRHSFYTMKPDMVGTIVRFLDRKMLILILFV